MLEHNDVTISSKLLRAISFYQYRNIASKNVKCVTALTQTNRNNESSNRLIRTIFSLNNHYRLD